jgi:tripartite-type tricarboxylate transporter receptor subunit TctC
MKLLRRQFLHMAASTAGFAFAVAALPRVAKAQAYPARPVRIVVPVPPGGGMDTVARQIGQLLAERLGQSFVIENRPGGGTNIGTEAVVRAEPDGYTLLLVSLSNVINPSLYDKLSYNFIRDIAPVAGIAQAPFVMVVSPTLPAKTVPEFIAYAKANAGKINMASGGNGSGAHVSGELFKLQTGVEIQHVPYRGSAPALTDLLGGQMQVMFADMPSAIGQIRGGKLRALAVTSAKRSPSLPDVPTVSDVLPGFEASLFFGIGAPKNTPAEIVDRLNKAINAALADPKFKATVADMGGTMLEGSPAAFGTFLADEVEKWAKVVKFAAIKPN